MLLVKKLLCLLAAAVFAAPVANAQLTGTSIVISEVFFSSSGGFIELYNPTGAVLVLDGIQICTASNMCTVLKGTLEVEGYLVICTDVSQNMNCAIDATIIQLGAVGGQLFLLDADDNQIDLVTGGDMVEAGQSLQRAIIEGILAFIAGSPSLGAGLLGGVAVTDAPTPVPPTTAPFSPAPTPFPSKCANDPNFCGANADCEDLFDGGARCVCKEGYTGDGITCIDADECATETPCALPADGGFCVDEEGTFKCGCLAGFTGDGITCTDIKECDGTDPVCGPNTVCTDVDGGFECPCLPGYAGEGKFVETGCSDINECMATPAPCDDNAVCTNVDGSFTCTCNAGYEGDGVTCIDTDECAVAGTCNSNADCVNSPAGSFTCTCKAGFTGNGVSCTAIPVTPSPVAPTPGGGSGPGGTPTTPAPTVRPQPTGLRPPPVPPAPTTSEQPTTTMAPSLTSNPSEVPSLSQEPSITTFPSLTPSLSLSPSLTDMPSGEPSISDQPSA